MKTNLYKGLLILGSVFFIVELNNVFAQQNFDNSDIHFYQKKELNWGALFYGNNEREELRTDESREYEEIITATAKFLFKNQIWNYLDYKQEQFIFNFEAGPLWGYGNWIDSSHVKNAIADHNVFGFRTNGFVEYTNRFYYSNKSFTLVQVNARARYDIYRQHSTGLSTDSSGVTTDIDEITRESKLRYGFLAKAGWGIGRLNPVNHFMIADYILNKYYQGRTFSYEEKANLAAAVGEIKQRRDFRIGHDAKSESEQIQQIINQKMFLTIPETLEEDWMYGEFLPRFSGNRVEFGPFFTYYNQEPDFIYGGYFLFEHSNYCNYKWNRNFKTGINYNRYKRQDWILAEIDLGWSYFVQLRSQFDFGITYIPGVQLNSFEDVGKLNHGLIPYFGYFTQLNSATRVNFTLAFRISEDESLMLPGPEFSLSVYRSRY